jgi:hypothetical protein
MYRLKHIQEEIIFTHTADMFADTVSEHWGEAVLLICDMLAQD